MMQEDITELAKRVLELDKDATIAPWGYQEGALKHYVFSVDGSEDFGISLQELHWEDGHEVPAAANAKLIAEYRTAAPKLAQAVLELQQEIAALRPGLEGTKER